MDWARLAAFAVVALVVIAIPGPSVLFVVSRAVALGRRAALGTVVGNSLGELLQVLVVALGMGPLLERSAIALTVVKLVGAAYLGYLGVSTWRGRRRPALAPQAVSPPRSRAAILRDGLVVGASNPKSMVFFAAVLPEFVVQGQAPFQFLVLGLVWVAIALLSDSVWAVAAGTARGWLARRPRQLEHAQGASAVVMVSLAVGLAATSRAS